MKAVIKYAIVLASGLAVGFYVRGPLSLEEVVRLNWLDNVHVSLNKALASARTEAAVPLVDPARAALVDEELDYRIAQRVGSLEGWRLFLAAHGGGTYAAAARAEVERLAATNPAPPDPKPHSDVPTPTATAEAQTPDEACKRDGERLDRLRGAPSSDEGARFAKELSCEALRPQLVALIATMSPAPQPQAVADVAAAAPAASEKPAGSAADAPLPPARDEAAAGEASEASVEQTSPAEAAPPPAPVAKASSRPKQKATGVASRGASVASTRPAQPAKSAKACASKFGCFKKAPSLPPLLLALLGEKPKHPVARPATQTKPNDLRGR